MMLTERSLLLGGILCGSGRERRRKLRTQHHDRRALLVFGCQPQTIAAQIHADAIGLAARLEAQGAPVDGDLATADPEKAAEIDNSGANLAVAINDHINDPPHVL